MIYPATVKYFNMTTSMTCFCIKTHVLSVEDLIGRIVCNNKVFLLVPGSTRSMEYYEIQIWGCQITWGKIRL